MEFSSHSRFFLLIYSPKKIGVKYQSINPSQVKENNYDVIKSLSAVDLVTCAGPNLFASDTPRDKTKNGR